MGYMKVYTGPDGTRNQHRYAVSQIPGGMLAERFGARKVVAAALMLWSAFTITTALASQFLSMAIVRFLFGVGDRHGQAAFP